MENQDNKRRPEIQVVEVKRIIPRIIKIFGIKPYLRNKPKPIYNSRNSNLRVRIDYLA